MHRLCRLTDLDKDYPFRSELPDGTAVAVYLLEEEVFATADLCSHGDASLAEGYVENHEVICPFHMGRFDIRTGAATGEPCHIAIRTYPVQLIDGEVMFVED